MSVWCMLFFSSEGILEFRPTALCASSREIVMNDYRNEYQAENQRWDLRLPLASVRTKLQQSPSPPRKLSAADPYGGGRHLFGIQDSAMDVPKPHRNRRKSNPNSDQLKHRRTRSGCYTCRSRRVKVRCLGHRSILEFR